MNKKFPIKKILKSKQYYLKYIDIKNNLLKEINFKQLDQIIALIKKVIKSKNIIYTCGNGGSASLADHFACDFTKQLSNKTNLKAKSISLSSNFALISAIANDINFNDIYSYQVDKFCNKNDLLFIFSVSGNSLNCVKAAVAAKKKGLKTVSFTGFNGGKLSKLTNLNINFRTSNYGIAEDCQISIMHYLSQYIRNIYLSPNKFKKTYF